MKIELYAKDGEFHAKYGWGEDKGVPLNARMGQGPPSGFISKDLRIFLNTITEHITGIENIEPIYGDGISEDLKAATSVLFDTVGKNNRYKSKMRRLHDILLEPDPFVGAAEAAKFSQDAEKSPPR
jgi:hypothetical protein